MQKQSNLTYALLLIGVLALAASSYLYYQNQQQSNNINSLLNEKSSLQDELAMREVKLDQASSTIAQLSEQLTDLGVDLENLADDYRSEKNRNEDFQDQIKDITKTVGVLDKLSKTDTELLQKYSKVSFLNEHYIPESLKEIDDEWKYNEDKELELHSKVVPYFEKMEKAAKADGVEFWVVSAYRSFGQQAALKGNYLVTYGSGANTFSADQGYSEHQLGTTIDFTTKGLGGGLDGFASTEAYQWLLDNAYKYGFTLSYSENNSYYTFEPWHWRFVGEDLAKDLNRANAHIYDWDQRKIDEYLISIFD